MRKARHRFRSHEMAVLRALPEQAVSRNRRRLFGKNKDSSRILHNTNPSELLKFHSFTEISS